MTSSIFKKATKFPILASFLTIIFVNSSFAQTNGCEFDGTRSKRDTGKIQVKKEGKKHDDILNKVVKKEKVFLKKAVRNGAVCLDGSPPGYDFKKGFGNGMNKWIVFFSGGAWCFDEQSCYQRSHTAYGSTRFNTMLTEGGLYSSDPETNPTFFNWNMVFVIYCDGSSFTGMRQNPVYFKDKPVYFRGKAILEAIVQDLLTRGIAIATDVLLSGSSAGSLAVLIHADFIKSKLNPSTKVRAVADSGYFVDLATQHGTNKTRDMFNHMLLTHNSSSSLHPACIKRTSVVKHWKCFFPQYFSDLVKTPIFVLQSAYDVWQIVNNLDVVCTIPSYEDILLFRALKRTRTSRKGSHNPVVTLSRNSSSGTAKVSRRMTSWKSRKKSHKSAKGNYRGKRNLIYARNGQWRSSVPRRNSEFLAPQRVNYFVPRAERLDYLTPLIPEVSTSQVSPIWHSPDWRRNTLETRSSWNNPAKSRVPVNAVKKNKTQKTTAKGWHWQSLYSHPTSCTKDETEKILNLRNLTIEALKPVIKKARNGLFLSPCFEHTQGTYSSIWRNTKAKGTTLRDAIVDWYFGKPGNHVHIGQEFEFSSCIT